MFFLSPKKKKKITTLCIKLTCFIYRELFSTVIYILIQYVLFLFKLLYQKQVSISIRISKQIVQAFMLFPQPIKRAHIRIANKVVE